MMSRAAPGDVTAYRPCRAGLAGCWQPARPVAWPRRCPGLLGVRTAPGEVPEGAGAASCRRAPVHGRGAASRRTGPTLLPSPLLGDLGTVLLPRRLTERPARRLDKRGSRLLSSQAACILDPFFARTSCGSCRRT